MTQMVIGKGRPGTFSIPVTSNGAAVDITGAQLFWKVKFNPADPNVAISKSVGSGITITDGPGGLATLSLIGTDTADFEGLNTLLFFETTLDRGFGIELIDTGTFFVQSDSTSHDYISLTDVRDEGVTVEMADNDTVMLTIRTWQAFLERACRQWFYPKDMILEVDGTDSDALHFGVPIINLYELRVNGQETALEPSYYRVYTDGEDRKNPRVKLIDNLAYHHDIYTAPMGIGRLLFRKGRKNQYIRGVFGYIEPDGSPPALIKRALMKLVIEKLAAPLVQDPTSPVVPPPLLSGLITEEWTDGHKIKRQVSGGSVSTRAPGLTGITDDQEVLNIIKLYKAPLGVATQAHTSYR